MAETITEAFDREPIGPSCAERLTSNPNELLRCVIQSYPTLPATSVGSYMVSLRRGPLNGQVQAI